MTQPNKSNVVVAGLGYVGAVTAACLASLGHRVTGVDRDQYKVDRVRQGLSPFYEPGLDELMSQGCAAGLLSATTSMAEAIPYADVMLICVGTPSEVNGNLGLGQLRRVAAEIGELLNSAAGRARLNPLVVAVRSTVFPGTCEEVVMPELPQGAAAVISNPEFLREGAAVEDFLKPSLLVVGGQDRCACEAVAGLYAGLPVEPCIVGLRTAELIKYACNSFHAVKVAFANEIGSLAERLGVDGHEVMHTLCQDRKLNASAAYLKPGFAFGGSCLPKDLRALVYRARHMDVHLPLLENTLPSNQQHVQRALRRLLDLPPRSKLGVVGLAFKEDTDDLRESPTVELIEQLIGKGREIRIWDPHIRLDSIYGTNRQFLLNSLPHVSRLMADGLDELIEWADHLVVTQKPSREVAARLATAGRDLVDLAGVLRPA